MALAVLGTIFLLGVIGTFVYTRLMVNIGQSVLKRVRDDMFEHMQTSLSGILTSTPTVRS